MSLRGLPARLGAAWKTVFWPASVLYGAAVKGRSLAYRAGWIESVRLPVPVFCVGNITVGGSGKTPGVVWLVEYLRGKGRRPAVVTRGYGARAGRAVRVVSDGDGKVLPVAQAGDEPAMLARRLPMTPIVAGADRALAGRHAVEALRADALVLDDGFQHLRLHRDVNLLCMDATEVPGFFERGGACLLPAGRLREPMSALWRADVLLLTRAELLTPERLMIMRLKMEEYLLDVPVVPVRGVQTFADHASGEARSDAWLMGRAVLAVSGLAKPEAFEEALRRRGMRVAAMRFPDHHFFSAAERARVLARARAESRVVVVTEKDAVRLPPDFPCVVARLDWSPEETRAREKGDTTPQPRTEPWTKRLDSAIA